MGPDVGGVALVSVVSVGSSGSSGDVEAAWSRIGASRRRVLAAPRRLERALDLLLRVRVVADVAGQGLDRVVVAVEVVRAVDPAVLVPVVDHGAAARWGRAGRRRDHEQRRERGEEHEQAERSSGWLVGGCGDQGLESGAIVPRIVQGMVQSLPDGIEVRVSGW